MGSAGAGFLMAVLWFDLMFDVQARGHREGDVPDEVLSSIGAYYARVTTAASPMNRLVPVAMLATLVGIVGELLRDELPAWRAGAALALAAGAIGLAGARTVRSAKRLGRRRDDAGAQSRLARSILRDHVACACMILPVLLLQLLPA